MKIISMFIAFVVSVLLFGCGSGGSSGGSTDKSSSQSSISSTSSSAISSSSSTSSSSVTSQSSQSSVSSSTLSSSSSSSTAVYWFDEADTSMYYDAAESYCSTLGGRLPTADEIIAEMTDDLSGFSHEQSYGYWIDNTGSTIYYQVVTKTDGSIVTQKTSGPNHGSVFVRCISDTPISSSSSSSQAGFAAPLKKTGQMTIIETYDDGHYQSGVIPEYVRDDEKQIVTDNITHLQWQDNDDVGSNKITWEEAKLYCENLDLDTNNTWRLPSILELSSILDMGQSSGLDNTFQNSAASFFWTLDVQANYTSKAWFVGLGGGGTVNTYNVSDSFYTRCVSGESLDEYPELVRDDVTGIVEDKTHKLMWQDSYEGTEPYLSLWSGALSYCEALTLGGYDDWHLPNRNELQAIMDYSKYNPAIASAFSYNQSYISYWSSTSLVFSTDMAWTVSATSGQISQTAKNGKYTYSVRCVRDVE